MFKKVKNTGKVLRNIGNKEFIPTLLAPIIDERRPDTLASSIIFI